MSEWVRRGQWWTREDACVCELVPVVAGGTTASFTQAHARFRNDDGTETTATWFANEDANASLLTDTNYRIRTTVDETAGGSSANFTGVLRYSLNGGAYTAVSASSSVVRASASPNVADEAATTQQLTAPAGTFLAGAFDEVDGVAGTTQIDFAAGQYTEVEHCFQIRSVDVADGDTIDFRVYRGANALNSYAVTIRATALKPVAAAPGVGVLTAAGVAPSLGFAIGLTLGTLGLTGSPVGVRFQGPEPALLQLVGQAPTVIDTPPGGGDITRLPDMGVLALGGQSPALGFSVDVASGALMWGSQAPVLDRGSTPASGTLQFAGAAPTFDLAVNVPFGTLAFEGQTPTAPVGGGNVPMAPGLGVLAFTGQGLAFDQGIALPHGALVFAGQTSSLAQMIPLPSGALIFDGQTPTMSGAIGALPLMGALTVSGQAPSLGHMVPPLMGVLTLSGQTPLRVTGATLLPATGSLAFSGQALTLAQMMALSSGTLSLAGQAPLRVTDIPRFPLLGVLTLSGQTATAARGVDVPAGGLVFAGAAPGLNGALGITLQLGTVTLAGQAPSLGRTLPVLAGTLTFTGQTPTLSFNIGRAPASGLLVFTGFSPGVNGEAPLPVQMGQLVLAGYPVTFGSGLAVSSGTLTLAGQAPMRLNFQGIIRILGAHYRMPVFVTTTWGVAQPSEAATAVAKPSDPESGA